jgi:hypothetical protein
MAWRAPWATAAASSSRPTTRTPWQRRCLASWPDSARPRPRLGLCAAVHPQRRRRHLRRRLPPPARQPCRTRPPGDSGHPGDQPASSNGHANLSPPQNRHPRDACLRRPSGHRHSADIAAGIARCPDSFGRGAGRGG